LLNQICDDFPLARIIVTGNYGLPVAGVEAEDDALARNCVLCDSTDVEALSFALENVHDGAPPT
jgi:hypothetical protein